MKIHKLFILPFALGMLTFISFNASAQKLKDKINKREQFGGKESSLQDKVVKEVKIISDPDAKIIPGSTIGVGMVATLEDGKEMKTKGYADGKTKWGNYIVKVTGGTFDDGDIKIFSDPRKIPGNKITISAALYSDSTNFKNMEFKLGFKASYTVNYDGQNGEKGKWGENGKHGNYGKDNSGGDGGNGSDAENGRNGANGKDGELGQTVDVYITAFKSESGETLLKVYVKSKTLQQEDFFILDPSGGSLTIQAKGGNGGEGGHGGDGGGGFPGGNGNKDTGKGGNGGKGGDGGDGGDGGNGGNGGSITVYLDPSASAFASIIKCENDGGRPGTLGLAGKKAGGGRGGMGKTNGNYGTDGVAGKSGSNGKNSGQKGPDILILKQASGIDWDKVGLK